MLASFICGRFFLNRRVGEMYETLDGIAHFEVIRSDPGSPWGWRADACTYHEDYIWDTADAAAEAAL